MTRDIQQLRDEWQRYQTNPPRYGKVWSDQDMGLAIAEIDRLRAENGSIWDHLQRVSRSLDNTVKDKDQAVFDRTKLIDRFNALHAELSVHRERYHALQAEFAAYRERHNDQKESLTRKALRDLIDSVMSDD